MGHIRPIADYASECSICRQSVTPGSEIVLLGKGAFKHYGISAHSGCYDWPHWKDEPQRNPCLTHEQVDAMTKAIAGARLPGDDVQIMRFLGALRKAAEKGYRPSMHTAPEIRMVMGIDLYDGYQKLIRELAGRRIIRDWWNPKQVNGAPWTDPRTTPPEPETKAPVPQQAAWRAKVQDKVRRVTTPVQQGVPKLKATPEQADIFEKFSTPGWWVQAGSICKVLVGPAQSGLLWVKRTGGEWETVSAKQVKLEEHEARRDAQRYAGRIG